MERIRGKSMVGSGLDLEGVVYLTGIRSWVGIPHSSWDTVAILGCRAAVAESRRALKVEAMFAEPSPGVSAEKVRGVSSSLASWWRKR